MFATGSLVRSLGADQCPFFGTFAPRLRASDKPMAMACFRLVTFLPEPLLSVPCLRSCMVFCTFDCAVLPYWVAMVPLLGEQTFEASTSTNADRVSIRRRPKHR